MVTHSSLVFDSCSQIYIYLTVQLRRANVLQVFGQIFPEMT